ncbi:hypothetical protein [Streptomyces sp. UNOB3_S3]|uniref:hypothetical protein n=1 Tax=Streptomyces sp. UNOB3_S3 TaxID=2871682 RepID=UPI001E340D35|nr:hypothetical protein [Streptomyces sp. UNOB3_S3]MCC3775069.1 hypothetical protein [Streptomyces sp. UNOB3_S3]
MEGTVLEEISGLAAAGAASVVTAMATDTWQTARAGLVRLFRRTGRERQQTADIEALLDSGAHLVVQAAEPEQARQSLIPLWQFQLVTLLREHPDAEAELRSLVQDIRDGLPRTAQTSVQNIDAGGNSRVNAVIHGNVILHGDGSGRPPGRPDADDGHGAVDAP